MPGHHTTHHPTPCTISRLLAMPDSTPPADLPPPDAPAAAHPHRPMRSFVLRVGRMGSGQVRALQALGPQFVLPYTPALVDWDAQFGRKAPQVLEIGFGMG